MENNLIETKKLNFSFGKRQILYDLSLRVPEGSIFGFLGPNGAGKTTTIKCLLGLYQVPDAKINLFGSDINHHRLSVLAKTGNMVEEPSLYGHLSAFNNLAILATLRKCPKKRIPEVLELVGLLPDAKRPVRQFSSGMKQRLCLAMALLPEPELLILDEPINGLDPGGIIEVRTILQKLCENHNVTIFISSHILSEIERLCSHIAVIHQGKLLFQGEMDKLPSRNSDTQIIILETGHPEQSKKLLENQWTVKIIESKLQVWVRNKEEIANIITILVNAKVPVYQVKPEINDLESAFLELIQH
ncbi:MAG: ABC transporter ATP-binding protein [Bacteroidales bacterium]